MIAGRLREADLLYQLGAIETAAARLSGLAQPSVEASTRLAALARLAEIACDLGDAAAAARQLDEMRRIAQGFPGATAADRAELYYALGRHAFSRRDCGELERRAREVQVCAREASGNVRVASLAIRIGCYLAVDRYHRRNLGGAFEAAATAAKLLRGTPGALPHVKTHALTTRGVIDLHDPARAHLATAENVEALELALANGMTSTAQDALFNIVNFQLYCDVSDPSAYESRVVQECLDDAVVAPSSSDDPVLAALALCSHRRYGEAAELLDRIGPPARERASDWIAAFFGPVTATKRARILFKAGKFSAAERAAAEALTAWERSQLGGHGIALRVRAEALEALGDVRGATATIEDAIGALEPIQPIYHMIGAYQCGHRLTKKRAYLDHAHDLVRALEKIPQQTAGLTPREREVAALVAQGYSNKAIAAQLHLSTRTVENRVASIFAHLSIRARWQLTTDHLNMSSIGG
ncbi:MAG TPA: helix-turn-helix transcriptional regulator [Candidatus Cybelea sp.]